MRIDILTTFPHFFDSILSTSILGRAIQNGILSVRCTDIRQYSMSRHRNTDDYPFGGGACMLMMPQPAADAIKAVRKESASQAKVIYMSPQGIPFTQKIAQSLSKEEQLIFLCGHYEGIDQRVIDKYVDLELSIGDYVLTGGEIASIVVIDCISRLIPGVLGSEESIQEESFSNGLLEYPQYTRPRIFEGMEVPEVLLSGDHARINRWRKEQALLVTGMKRPDMLKKTDDDE